MLILLWPLVHINRWLRRHGLAKDKMFWADHMAIRHGALNVSWFYGDG